MDDLNAILTRAFDALLWPLADWPPIFALLAAAAVTGVLAAVVFRFTSDQAAVGRAADEMRAHLLALRLFEDDLHMIAASLGGVLAASGRRIAHSLPPTLVLIVPFLVVLAQLALRFEHGPLAPGRTAVVEVRLAPEAWRPLAPQASNNQAARVETGSPGGRDAPTVAIDPPAGVVVETPPLRDANRASVAWRIRAGADGDSGPLLVRLPGATASKWIAIGAPASGLQPASLRRATASLWSRLFEPGEPALPGDGPVREIVLHYDDAPAPLLGPRPARWVRRAFGWIESVPWWLTFVVGTIAAAMLSRPLVRVRF